MGRPVPLNESFNAETLRHKEIVINSSKNFIAENAKTQRRRDFVIPTIVLVNWKGLSPEKLVNR